MSDNEKGEPDLKKERTEKKMVKKTKGGRGINYFFLSSIYFRPTATCIQKE